MEGAEFVFARRTDAITWLPSTPTSYSVRISRSPVSTSPSRRPESLSTNSVRNDLSSVRSWDTFTTESRGNPVTSAGSNTLPGASTSRRLLVITATMTVRIPLRLKESAGMISTGRRKPGSEPRGFGRSAHQISPRVTAVTSYPFQESVFVRIAMLDPVPMVLLSRLY
jgi:hypothetical protein